MVILGAYCISAPESVRCEIRACVLHANTNYRKNETNIKTAHFKKERVGFFQNTLFM